METYYIPYPVKKDASNVVKGFLHMTLKHMADFQSMMVDILSEKYGIDPEEMFKVVQDHPRYKELIVNPMIHDISSVDSVTETFSTMNISTTQDTSRITIKCSDGTVKTKKVIKKKNSSTPNPPTSELKN